MPGWVEIIIRSVVAFIILLITSKLFIKKSIAHFSYFDATSMLIIGVILAFGSFQIGIPIGYSLTALITWIAIVGMANYISMKSISFRNFIHGKGIPVIKDGKVLEDNLKKERYTTDDLLKQLRAKNVFKVADVEFAVLESSGDINVLLKKENQPLTAKDMLIPVAPIKEPQTVVMDGKVMDEALATIGLSRAWLEGELDKQGFAIENIFLGQVDSFGELTVDLFDDKIKVAEPKERPLLLASMKKVQADLEIFSLQTENEQAKKMFVNCATEMDEALKRVQKYLH
ncbi:DUF421 domain-containing protein [Anaerobacillus isosaccharinicus]|uniref:DUF421 domain-containing protein n=1 Tax=Anaerobacillus isosaccharinicus TaxID=1532552 RepID=A0A1S2M3Q4_9BACI|nr:DUF421 domain-containing protein [Anaerobacillus isosaccharinicus]MBA5585773.1 DUF421 domain-containing protein [Anaerobacillus isosaccharinicus]QOY38768.1 DUF421 domain-containing protein [Anaerobacillus isosaccharinicus]